MLSEENKSICLEDIKEEINHNLVKNKSLDAGSSALSKWLDQIQELDFRAHSRARYDVRAKNFKELNKNVYKEGGNVDSTKDNELAVAARARRDGRMMAELFRITGPRNNLHEFHARFSEMAKRYSSFGYFDFEIEFYRGIR
ncbi:hypothetical protein QA596_07885 [Balneolales bacterium ANBcel1]|nr:hypothetical protein [Balneolales bacterium ANBcel1]